MVPKHLSAFFATSIIILPIKRPSTLLITCDRLRGRGEGYRDLRKEGEGGTEFSVERDVSFYLPPARLLSGKWTICFQDTVVDNAKRGTIVTYSWQPAESEPAELTVGSLLLGVLFTAC